MSTLVGGSRAALNSGDYLFTFSLNMDRDVEAIVGSEGDAYYAMPNRTVGSPEFDALGKYK